MFKTKFDWYRVALGITLATGITAVIYMVCFLMTDPTEPGYEPLFSTAVVFGVVTLFGLFTLWVLKRRLKK